MNISIKRIIVRLIPDKQFVKIQYRKTFGKKLRLNNPITFNEKLNWLKLHDRNILYSKMVDKYEAKQYVANSIGRDHIIPTLGIYDSFDEINFKKLPNSFVIKCTHDSGGLVICRNKQLLDIKEARKKINNSLRKNYYYHSREWPYKNVKPRIIIEKYMLDNKTNELRDYKFFCFNGKVKFFKIDFDRFTNHRANYYDTKGKLQKFGEQAYPPDYNKRIDMPKNLKTMIKFAEILSNNIPFLRVDFYEINEKVYFGELTFYPASGFGIFTPKSADEKIGKLLDLNGIKTQ